jgi:hypothetical protein
MTVERSEREEMTNDKWHFENKEEDFTLAAIRYPGRSFATGSAGFLFWQSNHLFVL